MKTNSIMEPVPLCETCGKVVRPIREGSLTSWLFFDNRCACALQSKILNGPQLSQGRQDPPPQLDDGYELLNLLGQGGMSRVYKVRERESNKIVACKVMDSTMAQDAQAVARFEKEAKACLALSHPNLVVVHGSSITKSGEPYLIMDYLDGITLQDLLKQNGRLKPERALSLMKEVADALAAAHQTGIIHRDLKPSNIMVTTCGDKEEVKVLDFGIARIMPVGVDHSQNLTSTGEIIGSPFYMSPEQCKGVEIDERSDIYSFGCVLYEMLAGTPPFVGKNAMQTVLGHLTEFPKSIIDKKSGIDSRLENVVLKCLEKDPQERYRSVAELSHDLQLLKAGLKPALQPGAELVKRRRKDRQKKIVRVTT
ncbi:MAG: serine/threonine protein kinase, partial [Cyanobacteria bacterium]|nr:serine/threonine protein kinase [Cyanobacteriota bacterium]